MFTITAIVLTMQEYYGGQRFFLGYIRPWLRELEAQAAVEPSLLGSLVDTRFWGELYAYAWWALTRVAGYTLVPMAIWKLLFRKDSLLDMGLRLRGLREHIWIYGLC